MKKIYDLYKIIDKEKIILEECKFKNNIDGIYFKIPELEPTIGINTGIIGNSKIYISILAEELGHHFTTMGDLTAECIIYRDKLIRNKKELKARRWAANYLINDNDLQEALYYPVNNINALCDYFNVTDEIITMKLLSISYDDNRYKNIKNLLLTNECKYELCEI